MEFLTSRVGFAVVFLLFGFTFNSLGQSADAVASYDPPIYFEIRDSTSPGCCGGYVLGKHDRPDPMGARLTNIGQLPIRAYAVIVDVDGHKDVRFVVYSTKAIEPGQVLGDSYTFDRSVKVSFSLDFVKYADDTTWGHDTNEKSKLIDAYLEGRELAIARIKEVAGEQEAPSFIGIVSSEQLMSSGDPLGPPKPERVKSFKHSGYQSIVRGIRFVRARKQGAEALADKLDQMEQAENH